MRIISVQPVLKLQEVWTKKDYRFTQHHLNFSEMWRKKVEIFWKNWLKCAQDLQREIYFIFKEIHNHLFYILLHHQRNTKFERID